MTADTETNFSTERCYRPCYAPIFDKGDSQDIRAGRPRQAASGALITACTGGDVVPASEYCALVSQVRELQRMRA